MTLEKHVSLRQKLVAFLIILALQLGSGSFAYGKADPVTLERFLYFTTDEKLVVDFKFDQRTTYKLEYIEASNQIVIELPHAVGDQFYTQEIVHDSALHIVRVEPLMETAPQGVRVVLELHHKVPAPLAFHVSQGRRLLVEAKKESREGFETFAAPGIAYGHWRKDTPNGPLFVNYMKVDPSHQGIKISPRLAEKGKEAVHEIANRHGAIGAINGIYFAPDGTPLGMIIIDGKLVSEPYLNRTALGIKGDGTFIIDNVGTVGEVRRIPAERSVDPLNEVWPVDGVNRRRLEDELIIYTLENGTNTQTNQYGWEVIVEAGKVVGFAQGSAQIPESGFVLSGHGQAADWLRSMEIGDAAAASWSLEPDWLSQDILHAIGGGPRLLRAGEVDITAESERFQKDITEGRAPRTALGITAAGELLLVTVNGRQGNISIGMTLTESAELLKELGAVDAMNLDGGGSSTMVVRGIVLNAPSDGRPRSVSNALLVWAGEETN